MENKGLRIEVIQETTQHEEFSVLVSNTTVLGTINMSNPRSAADSLKQLIETHSAEIASDLVERIRDEQSA
jgi:hypothetical protein